MAFTYSQNPSGSSRDAVRFLLRDTVEASCVFNDAEIEWLLAQQPNVYRAAALGARTKANEAVDNVSSKTVGSLTLTYSDRAGKWLELAESLEKQADKGLGSAIGVYSGGISKADKEAQASDDDWDDPWFYREMWDNPGSDLDYDYPRSSS
jgi:hypothetical protein